MNVDSNPEMAAEFVEELSEGDRVRVAFHEKVYTEDGYEVGDEVVIEDTATITGHSSSTVLEFDNTLLSNENRESPYGKLTTTEPPELRLFSPDEKYSHGMVGMAILSQIERVDK